MGTFYRDAPYNMFYNPAFVNDYKRWITVEKSKLADKSTGAGGVGSEPDSTRARIGTTLKYGKLDFDWVLGSGNYTAGEAGQYDSQALGISESLLTAASLTYSW